MKRFLDILISAPLLVLVSPVLAICAAAIRFSSPGPALFGQMRLGRGGVPFQIWKLRSMYVGSADTRNPDGSAYTGAEDRRVTPIGKFLRATSLDELPQLYNVLRGEMSLVGPRPDLADQIRFYVGREFRKLEVQPGITGLAQINGRNAISWAYRKALDIEYVERQCLLLDFQILWRTIPYVCLRKSVSGDGELIVRTNS